MWENRSVVNSMVTHSKVPVSLTMVDRGYLYETVVRDLDRC